jgi:pimeloyl-ACP methyl ester carboxylesterase
MMMEGFKRSEIKTSGANIVTVHGGNGPPLLLMHGNPFTHLSWHKFAPRLAKEFTVVCTDLRGYGGKPEGGPDHAAYAKRAMAQDMVEVMAALGHQQFLLAGHDRSGFEIHVFDNNPAPDDFTASMRPLADRWHEVHALSDAQLADLIRAEQIDILVDLTGHFGRQRLLTFARKPARAFPRDA